MILTRCPMRIGLAGGSTDLDKYMEHHGRGAVINFPINIYTYINVHQDLLGYSSYHSKYQINYSKQEFTNKADEIENDLVRVAFEHFNVPPCLLSMTGDVFANGSGLASSSSYMISLIKAITTMKSIRMSNFEISKLAMKLERQVNPLLGYQDTYGCGIGSLKRMDFLLNESPRITYMPVDLLTSFDMYVVFTGTTRSSTEILKSIRVTHDDSLLKLVDEMENSLMERDRSKFIEVIKEGWRVKKQTSENILQHSVLKRMDEEYENNKAVLCHRLCGAGNGGFFLIFCDKGAKSRHKKGTSLKIDIDFDGAKVVYGGGK